MRILVVDWRATHAGNTNCPGRFYTAPNGEFLCLDCGRTMMHQWVEVDEVVRGEEGNRIWPPERPVDYTPLKDLPLGFESLLQD